MTKNGKNKQVSKIVKTDIVDCSTGSVIESTTRVERKHEEDVYVKFYLANFAFVLELTPSELKTVKWLLTNMEYNNGNVTVNIDQRCEIGEEIGVQERQVSNILRSLKTKRVILPRLNKSGEKQMRGAFLVNPYLFAKCNERDVIRQRQFFDWTERRINGLGTVKQMNENMSKMSEE